MSVNIYLIFNGNCSEALDFYEQVFNTKKYQKMTFGEAPQNPQYQIPEEVKQLVMHARMNIKESVLMFSDNYPGTPYTVGNNITLSYISKDVEDMKGIYNKLSEGGVVLQELGETFWSKCYGSVIDKFGIGWQLSHDNGDMGM